VGIAHHAAKVGDAHPAKILVFHRVIQAMPMEHENRGLCVKQSIALLGWSWVVLFCAAALAQASDSVRRYPPGSVIDVSQAP
jgi:hypothetical protein